MAQASNIGRAASRIKASWLGLAVTLLMTVLVIAITVVFARQSLAVTAVIGLALTAFLLIGLGIVEKRRRGF